MDGRQCWPPTWPIGFSHLDTSRCRTDPALPTATSSIDLEHILHIPATILQASVGSILSAPGQTHHEFQRAHTRDRANKNTGERTVRKRGVILRTEGREKIPFEPSGDTTANMTKKSEAAAKD